MNESTKPSISELDRILGAKGTHSIEILPNGEIRARQKGITQVQSHSDQDYVPGFDFRKLEERANQMVESCLSAITGGEPGEPTLLEARAENGIHVTRRPDDEQGILRISIGGGIKNVDINYCVFRGDPVKCVHLLKMATHAIEEAVR